MVKPQVIPSEEPVSIYELHHFFNKTKWKIPKKVIFVIIICLLGINLKFDDFKTPK